MAIPLPPATSAIRSVNSPLVASRGWPAWTLVRRLGSRGPPLSDWLRPPGLAGTGGRLAGTGGRLAGGAIRGRDGGAAGRPLRALHPHNVVQGEIGRLPEGVPSPPLTSPLGGRGLRAPLVAHLLGTGKTRILVIARGEWTFGHALAGLTRTLFSFRRWVRVDMGTATSRVVVRF
eukprot:1178510-Prorocentrum_minimum.AAC.1